jgi:hypothetical protein
MCVCVCMCVSVHALGMRGPRAMAKQKPRLTFLWEGIFSVSCLPASFAFLGPHSLSPPSRLLEALRILPKFVPREMPAGSRDSVTRFSSELRTYMEGVGVFLLKVRTKDWGRQDFRRHKSLLRVDPKALLGCRTKRQLCLPPPPAPSLAPSMGQREPRRVLKWICWAARAMPGNPHKLREQTLLEEEGWAQVEDIRGAYQAPGALTQALLHSFPVPGGATSVSFCIQEEVVAQATQRGQATCPRSHREGQSWDSNAFPQSQATSLGNQNRELPSVGASGITKCWWKFQGQQCPLTAFWVTLRALGHSGASTHLLKGLPGCDGKRQGHQLTHPPSLFGDLHSG